MTPPASTTSLRDFLTDATLFKESAYIGGEWIGARSTITIRNPANGETIGHVPDLGAEETHRAIAAAGAALPQWRGGPRGGGKTPLPTLGHPNTAEHHGVRPPPLH